VTLTRHFPSPWTAEDDGACFIVRDANRQAAAYVYYFDEESGAAQTANLVTREEARDIASHIAKLPEVLGTPQQPDANPLIQRRAT
jgi:hypothetical protein